MCGPFKPSECAGRGLGPGRGPGWGGTLTQRFRAPPSRRRFPAALRANAAAAAATAPARPVFLLIPPRTVGLRLLRRGAGSQTAGEGGILAPYGGSPGDRTGDFTGLSEAKAAKERKQCRLQ